MSARIIMYFMFFGTSTLHFLVREMAPMLIPLICDAYGYSLAQRGCAHRLLPRPAFFPCASGA